MRRTNRAKAAKVEAIDPVKKFALEAALTLNGGSNWRKVDDIVKDADRFETYLKGECGNIR